MGGVGLLYALDEFGAVAGLAVLWFAATLVLRRFLPWAGLWVLAAVLALAAVPVALEQRALRADLAAMAAGELRTVPEGLTPGRVLVLPGDMQLCRDDCAAVAAASWATSVTVDEYALTNGEFLVLEDRHLQDLMWPPLPRSEPMPYDYVVLAMSVYRLPGLPAETGRLAHWPESLQDVVILLRLPPDGRIDLEGPDVLYRRFAHLHFVSRYPLWPGGRRNVESPDRTRILAELTGRPGGSL